MQMWFVNRGQHTNVINQACIKDQKPERNGDGTQRNAGANIT